MAAALVPLPGRPGRRSAPIDLAEGAGTAPGPVRGASSEAIDAAFGIDASASTTSTTADPRGGASQVVPVPAASPLRAKSYQCVDGRQTFDPLSPACDTAPPPADNGGGTYPGVTANEVRVVAFMPGGENPDPSAKDRVSSPNGGYEDLSQPLKPGQPDSAEGKTMRAWVEWYNAHYQTFGRYVHVVIAYSDPNRPYYKPNFGEAYIGDEVARIGPFAGLTGEPGLAAVYNSRSVVAVGANATGPGAAAASAGLLWPYAPSLGAEAAGYAGYVCRRLVDHPVSFSGDPAMLGKPRKFGLVEQKYPTEGLTLGRLIEADVKACGGHIDAVATESGGAPACWAEDLNDPPGEGVAGIERFKALGITTVLWPTCADGEFAPPALALGFQPEWVVGQGDGTWEAKSEVDATRYGSLFDRHAVLIADLPPIVPLTDRRCWTVAQQADPTLRPADVDAVCQWGWFDVLRELFDLVQVAGPRLGPASMVRGAVSLPRLSSPDPLSPRCAFYADDLSCVKDGTALMWDDQAVAPSYAATGTPHGCWRPMEQGRRYLPDVWPLRQVLAIAAHPGPATDCDLFDQPAEVRAPNLDFSRLGDRL